MTCDVERRCFCGNSLEGRHPNARYCSRECGDTAALASVDEPCDPRELGPATVPGFTDSERRHRLISQYLHAEWRPQEIGALLDMHPDSVSRIAVGKLGVRSIQKRDSSQHAGILGKEG